jgi:hypothetical protein
MFSGIIPARKDVSAMVALLFVRNCLSSTNSSSLLTGSTPLNHPADLLLESNWRLVVFLVIEAGSTPLLPVPYVP